MMKRFEVMYIPEDGLRSKEGRFTVNPGDPKLEGFLALWLLDQEIPWDADKDFFLGRIQEEQEWYTQAGLLAQEFQKVLGLPAWSMLQVNLYMLPCEEFTTGRFQVEFFLDKKSYGLDFLRKAV